MKKIILNLTPPIFIKLIQKLISPQVKKTTTFKSFDDALLACTTENGYINNMLAEVVLQKTLVHSKQINNNDFLLCNSSTSSLFLSVLLSQENKTLNVLDFGGACGMHYFTTKHTFPQITNLKWKIVETKAMVEKARTIENDELSFFDKIDQANKDSKFNLIYSSGTIQYLSNPRATLKELIEIGSNYILLSRLSLSTGNEDVISIQKSTLSSNGHGVLPSQFTDTIIEYPHTNIPEKDFLEIIGERYKTIIKFEDNTGVHPVLGHQIIGYGLLLKRKY